MNPGLRLTDTNAASDSSGRTWGLEGSLVWWLIGGIGSAIVVFFALLVWIETSLLTSVLVAVVPLLLVLAYIFGLRQGKPPGYDRDLLELLLSGPGFAPEADPHRLSPPPWSCNR